MALLNSLNSGVTALKTFSRSLEVIGDNIANVNTTAFKHSRARNEDTFSDILQRSAPSDGTTPNRDAIQAGTGVQLASIRQSFTQGSISSTGVASDLAISGGGFFIVRNESTGEVFATRAGDFRIDDKGALMTNGGLNVQGLVDGSISYTVTKGTDISVTGANNYSTTFKLTAPDTATSLGLEVGGTVTGTGISAAGATITGIDATTGVITISTPTTGDLPATGLTFAKTISSTADGTATLATTSVSNIKVGMTVTGTIGGLTLPANVTVTAVDTTANNFTLDDGSGTFTVPAGTAGLTFSANSTAQAFSSSNILTLPSTVSGLGIKVGAFVAGTGGPTGAYVTKIIGPNQVEISADTTAAVASLTFNNLSSAVTRTNPGDSGAGDTVGNLKVNDGISFVNGSGATADQLDAFGFAGGVAPSITSFSINKDGTITCFLNDGKSFQRGRVLLKNFADPNALISTGNNLYTSFAAAGPVGGDALNKTDNTPGNDGLGEIIGGSLELSNVDLTQEFSDLIVTQRSFQAASRIITVCDSVLEELVNLKR